jgi:hypothetical protein
VVSGGGQLAGICVAQMMMMTSPSSSPFCCCQQQGCVGWRLGVLGVSGDGGVGDLLGYALPVLLSILSPFPSLPLDLFDNGIEQCSNSLIEAGR